MAAHFRYGSRVRPIGGLRSQPRHLIDGDTGVSRQFPWIRTDRGSSIRMIPEPSSGKFEAHRTCRTLVHYYKPLANYKVLANRFGLLFDVLCNCHNLFIRNENFWLIRRVRADTSPKFPSIISSPTIMMSPPQNNQDLKKRHMDLVSRNNHTPAESSWNPTKSTLYPQRFPTW